MAKATAECSASIRRALEEPFFRNLVRLRALQLVGVAGIRADELPDLEQEITLRVLRRIDIYRCGRGSPEAFLTTAVESAASSLVRHYCAAKRNRARERPFDDAQNHPAHASFDAFLETQIHLRDALEHLLSGMSAEQRSLCNRFPESSVSQIARDDGIPRTTVQSRISAIRRRFEEAGLREFL